MKTKCFYSKQWIFIRVKLRYKICENTCTTNFSAYIFILNPCMQQSLLSIESYSDTKHKNRFIHCFVFVNLVYHKINPPYFIKGLHALKINTFIHSEFIVGRNRKVLLDEGFQFIYSSQVMSPNIDDHCNL